jgi:hypothetical protein
VTIKYHPVKYVPLDWPVGTPRTRLRADNYRFKVSLDTACHQLEDELRLLQAEDVVITSNAVLSRSGLPLSDQKRVADPGVAIYWRRKGRGHVMACDRWNSLRSNFRELGLALAALRRLQDSGVSEMVDRVFQGFLALPASTTPKRAWWEVLNVPRETTNFDFVRVQYHAQLRTKHPDHGGTQEEFLELQEAYDAARRDLGGKDE